MSLTPREIGTLIVVILKANHLPNKRHIGKQDPYCIVTVNGEKRRTKAIKRGGQHPEWDEEIRFTLFEDTDDVLSRTARKDGTPPEPPPKDSSPIKRIKGGKLMKLACYADDSREPDLIGDADVDLTEVLTKGETDEWFTLTNKDKFAGKVYLELTFWSNEPAPEKKVTPKPTKNNKQYGGPGSFVPSGTKPSEHAPRSVSFSRSYAPQPDLYVAPYEQQNQRAPIDNTAHEYNEFGVNRRRESFPPAPAAYSSHPQANYNGHIGDGGIGYGYDLISSTGQSSGFYGTYSTQPTYSDPYGTHSSYQSTIRGPRHSVPTASSGFMPLAQPSGFLPVQSEPFPISHAPVPGAYTSAAPQQYLPQPAHTTHNTPLQGDPYLSGSTSGPVPYQGTYYPQYTVPASVSAPPQHYVSNQPAIPGPSGAHAGSPYQSYAPQPTHSESLPPSNPPPPPPAHPSPGSRPLPPQPIVYTQPISQQLESPQGVSNYSPSLQPGNMSPGPPAQSQSYPLPIPLPPPPIQNFNPSTQPVALPPPRGNGRSRSHSSLPQPPVAYLQHLPSYPPPPPPPLNQGQPAEYAYSQLPPPPPPPPPMIHTNGTNYSSYQTDLPLPPPPNPTLVSDQANWPAYNPQ